MYDVTIIGAGPAGLFAAYELAKNKNLKILIIEKGKEIKKRDSLLSGIGGAGLFSDGKLNLTAIHGKTNLHEFLSKKDADKLINFVDDIFIKFGAPKKIYTKSYKKAKELQRKAKKHNINLLLIKQKHLGSDRLPKLIDKFVNQLKKNNIKFLLNSEVRELIIKNNKIIGVKLNNKKIYSKYVIACPGRIGSNWILSEAKRLGIPFRYRGIEVGVRIELPAKKMKHITDYIWDPSLITINKDNHDVTRTFCVCPNGFVAQETYHGFTCVNGYCRIDKKSKNTNFALLSNIELTHPAENTIEYGRDIGRLATTIAGGKPFIQRLVDLKNHKRSYWHRINKSKVKPTLKNVMPADLTMAIPHRIVSNLLNALKQLDKVIPGINNDVLLYGPELKFFSVRILTNKNLETKVKNLFVAGDGVGVCGNIIGAAATGIIAARGILGK